MGKHSIEKRDNISSTSLFDVRVRLAAGQANSMASRRRTRKIGAAAGGLLGLAFLPLAVANADDWTVTPDPTSTETITGIYGDGFAAFYLVSPAVQGSIQGHQEFEYTDTTTGDSGQFSGFESTFNDGLGDTGQEVYVAADPSGSDAPSVGSVFDTYTAADGLFTNVYADVVSATGGADTITDTLETPFGDYNIPITFDAADVTIADAGGVTIGYGTDIEPVGSQAINAITGISPIDVALQGTQFFDVDNSTNPAFYADDTVTADVLSTYTEAVLVTKDLEGTVGTAAGDTPAVGSIVNTIGAGDIELVYSDLVGTNGGPDLITDTLDTPFGNFEIPTAFEATQAEDTSAIDLPGGDHLTPLGTLDYTGVNGLPPVDIGVQGTQDFDYTNADGTTGQFTADVTNTLDMFNDSTETVLVTSNTDPDAPIGSVFETVTWGDTGFENVYTDIVSATGGADTITDTLVTPLGDFTLPSTFEAAAGLATDMFGGI
jgi:hypothetical protein